MRATARRGLTSRWRPIAAGLTALVTAVGVGATVPTPASASRAVEATCPQGAPGGTAVPAAVPGGRNAVVLVHGWNGGPGSMDDLRAAVDAQLGDEVATFTFDYGPHNEVWAGGPEVSGCLAIYLAAISAASAAGGGDGKVFLVGHSMGGLAARYASTLTVDGRPMGEVISGVVTINTPHRGSYWGDTWYPTVLDGTWLGNVLSAEQRPLPDPSSDAALCLAHHSGGFTFPRACGAAPSYLPAGVPLHQVSGSISITRTFFGIPLYTYYLGGDSIVGLDSEQGYPGSGPADGVMARTTITMTSVECSATTGELVDSAALALRTRGVGPIVKAVGEALSDSAAMGDILAGRVSLNLLPALIIANLGTDCSHLRITSNAEAITATVDALSTWLGATAGSATSGPAGLVGRWGGEVFQHDNGRRYPVEISYRGGSVGSTVGAVIYPTLSCGGDLRLESAGGNEVAVSELINWGTGQCVNVVPMRLVLTAEGTVDYTFYRGSTLNGEATLQRIGSTVDTVPSSFIGTWAGEMTQPSSPHSPYSMEVAMTGGAINATVATVTYADLSCGGDWVLRWADPERLVMWEEITSGAGNCLDGIMVVTPVAAGLYFEWFRDGDDLEGSPTAWATLTRA